VDIPKVFKSDYRSCISHQILWNKTRAQNASLFDGGERIRLINMIPVSPVTNSEASIFFLKFFLEDVVVLFWSFEV
jgi:hypothetical protein